ncbi:porin family protein [Mariniflexile gromovii]|uniref:PorT family protein n=1 Tax=Mariniflexile gromovii TaxID=362523 RepID=A0ABS4BQD4_9FLAO|nr:porin family protein [Mariniflexile gromovii]MBP0902231.1 PorT family protein [Mariniflexile gromovii]
MKHKIIKNGFIVAVLFLSSISLKAQIKYGAQIHGQLNTASFTAETSPLPDKDWKFGYGGGFFVEIPISSAFSLKPSLNYLQKGVKTTEKRPGGEGGGTFTQKTRINLDYIEVPILAIYNLDNNQSKWYVGVGPSFGYGISGNAEVFDTMQVGPQTNTEFFKVKTFKDVEDGGMGFKRFDFGLNAIVGIHFLEKGMVQLGYIHGLSNIANKDDFEGNKYNNRSILLSLGYQFK